MTVAVRILSLLVAAAVLTACNDRQSALAPGGDDAAAIHTLTLVLMAGAGVILVLVGAGIWLAIAGPERVRALIADRRTIWIGGLALPVVTLSCLLGYALWLMRASVVAAARAPDLTIEVRGEQWWWRVTYLLADGRRLSEANEIRLPAGRAVEFQLTSADVIHSFWIPNLGGKLDMIPGRTNRLRLTPMRTGIYRGQCAEYCGGAHALMAKDIVVMEPEAFDRWLATPAQPPPAAEAETRGAALFVAAGCGGCHAVRNTAASGTIGPDLSRIGERRSIAAGTQPNTVATIERFIADSQHVKPGNLMPPFGALAADDRRAIARYLASLK